MLWVNSYKKIKQNNLLKKMFSNVLKYDAKFRKRKENQTFIKRDVGLIK